MLLVISRTCDEEAWSYQSSVCNKAGRVALHNHLTHLMYIDQCTVEGTSCAGREHCGFTTNYSSETGREPPESNI